MLAEFIWIVLPRIPFHFRTFSSLIESDWKESQKDELNPEYARVVAEDLPAILGKKDGWVTVKDLQKGIDLVLSKFALHAN